MPLTITFQPGTNLDQANVLVQNRVATAQPRLPAEVRSLGVTTRKASSDFLMVVHMLSPDDSFDQLYISNYTLIRVRDELLRLDGVGDVTVFGAREYSLRVWLDPEQARLLRALDDRRRRGAAGAERPGRGRRARRAARRRTDNAFQLTVQTQGRFENVAPVPGRHRQVGRTGGSCGCATSPASSSARATTRPNSYLDGKPAIGIGVFQRPGTNALERGRGRHRQDEGAAGAASRRGSTTGSPTTRPSSSPSR